MDAQLPRLLNRPSRDNIMFWLLLTLVAAVPAIAYFNLVMRHFYVLGAFWSDSGAIAAVLWHSDHLLHLPLVNGPNSFFAYHLTLIFLPLSWLSRVLPLSEVQYFAAISGFSFMLPGVAVYWLLATEFGLNKGWRRLAAAGLGLMFTFNGMALATARNPHFEMLIIGTGMLFLAALLRQKYRLALVFFVLCLATREDAGLHLALLLGVWAGLNWRAGQALRAQKPQLGFALAGLGYALAAMITQKTCFPGYNALREVYIGQPPFATLNWHSAFERLQFLLAFRLYIFLPMALAIIWASRARLWLVAGGYIACLPWLAVSFAAVSPFASTISNYYCFPFIFALFWPLAALASARQNGGPAPALRQAALFGALILASFTDVSLQTNPGKIEYPASFISSPSLALQRATSTAIAAIAAQQQATGRLAVDSGVAALNPWAFTPAQLLQAATAATTDTIIYFPTSYQYRLIQNLGAQAGMKFQYTVPGTFLRIMSRHNLSHLPGLPALHPLA